MRQFLAEHPEWREYNRVYSHAYRQAKPDKIRALNASWYAAHRTEQLAYHVRAAIERPEVKRAYRQKHREQHREEVARRHAKLGLSRIDHQAVYDRDRGLCHICGEYVPRNVMSLDHIWPLLGKPYRGEHTFMNVRCSHRLCNMRRQHRGAAQPYLL
jgi:hypothetical protein